MNRYSWGEFSKNVERDVKEQPKDTYSDYPTCLKYAANSDPNFRMLKDGAPVQSNFFDYNVLRMSQMPKVEVYIVPSTEPPSGVGEPGVPPIGPAVANALLAATGKTYAKLPLGTKA
jgi:hypothetical protein